MSIDLRRGDCLEVMKSISENSVDCIVTDPPYGLVSITKRFGKSSAHLTPMMKTKEGGVFARQVGGFMGKQWDGSGIEYNVGLWRECLRVLKPGGYLLSFAGTRTHHKICSAIEDAGFEIRDMIAWVYGSGFPKSLNIGKAVDKSHGELCNHDNDVSEAGKRGKAFRLTRGRSEWEGWGTALKPAFEPITVARKPLSEKTVVENCLKWGTGGINIDACRVPCEVGDKPDFPDGEYSTESTVGKIRPENRLPDANPTGRFPANLIHDGSEEVVRCFPRAKGGAYPRERGKSGIGFGGGKFSGDQPAHQMGDDGSAARFFKSCPMTDDEKRIFYVPKPSRSERNAGLDGMEERRPDERTEKGMGIFVEKGVAKQSNFHPCVKPIALLSYLIRMVSREGATVLDPFMGSGTTGVAAKKLNRNFIGIELDPQYFEIAKARIDGLNNLI